MISNNSTHKCHEFIGRTVFDNLLNCTKVGGYVIFATDAESEEECNEIIAMLQQEQAWKYVKEHQYYRFYKACQKSGK